MLSLAKRIRQTRGIFDFSTEQLPQTGSTLTATTAIGNQDIGSMCRGKNRLLCRAIELFTCRCYRDSMDNFANGIRLSVGCVCC